MARVKDILMFAPSVPFAAVDPLGEDLPSQWWARIEGFYLAPARKAGKSGDGFAAGVLALCAIDAIAYVATGSPIKSRFLSFVRRHLPSFASEEAALALFELFRNGLVHEGRIKLA